MAAFMTPRQVAERWECSPRHVRRLCASGELAAMRLGLDSWRIAVGAVEAYEAAHTTSAETVQQQAALPRQEVRPATVGGFTLPDDYEPVFPTLWPGHQATKKAASQRH